MPAGTVFPSASTCRDAAGRRLERRLLVPGAAPCEAQQQPQCTHHRSDQVQHSRGLRSGSRFVTGTVVREPPAGQDRTPSERFARPLSDRVCVSRVPTYRVVVKDEVSVSMSLGPSCNRHLA